MIRGYFLPGQGRGAPLRAPAAASQAARLESFQAAVCLQSLQTRSPAQALVKSLRHIRHLRLLATYSLSGSGFLFLLESLISIASGLDINQPRLLLRHRVAPLGDNPS